MLGGWHIGLFVRFRSIVIYRKVCLKLYNILEFDDVNKINDAFLIIICFFIMITLSSCCYLINIYFFYIYVDENRYFQ